MDGTIALHGAEEGPPGFGVRRQSVSGDAALADVPNGAVLSKRQEEILIASCRGIPDKIIADSLGVSPRTLEGHWRAIHRKLGSVNRCQAGFLFAALRENTHGKVLA